MTETQLTLQNEIKDLESQKISSCVNKCHYGKECALVKAHNKPIDLAIKKLKEEIL